ncbi:unnamed protein product [Acanthoscelides obtectus]|uniref:Uncharacterized protein n=1 Tax=Acanthoscelides obtectus TaxID=200917 RepID=A0A9P0NPY3_ACAOB|nr:unnamed protein product [Acanthoscelides obtectus]CAK1639749.1 hypothetical protein AOBTE_LOCUS11355 [Acanthoscelides obtectus]
MKIIRTKKAIVEVEKKMEVKKVYKSTNRERRPQHNIVLQLPALPQTTRNIGDSVDPLSVWKFYSMMICVLEF